MQLIVRETTVLIISNNDWDMKMEKVALLVLLSLLQYVYFSAKVGANRGKHGVKAPAVTGNEVWERLFRIQQNTLEQLIIFIPAMYIFAAYLSTKWALIPGGMYLIGRQIYSMSYAKDPKTRTIGFSLTFLAQLILIFGGLFGVVKNML